MANVLGQLVVKLGLDAADFTSGLTKAELQAQRFSQSLNKGIASAAAGAAAGIALIGTAAAAAVVAVDQLTKETAKFKDLEEITGASAESLASFAVSAKVAGTDMNTIAAASVKLTKGLTGVDDESKAAGAALAALGINIKDFKQLDPATQIDEIAKALDGFKDGAGKTAVAVALFGKAGAELLPFLKELGSGIGRQTILTQAQIEAADKYADSQARATATLNLYLQVLATQALGPMTAFTNALKEFVKDLVNVDGAATDLGSNTAVETFAINTAKALGFAIDAADGVIRVFRIMAKVLEVGVQNAGPAIRAILDQEQFSAKLERQLAELDANRRLPGESGGRRREAKTLVFDGAQKNAKALKDQTTEADRYLESLQKQLEKTQDLTVVEQILADIRQGRIKGITADQTARALALGAEIDAAHRLEEELKAGKKAFDEEVRAQKEAAKERDNATKAAFDQADRVKESNQALQDEIKIIEGGEPARKELERHHVQARIDILEEAAARLSLNEATAGAAEGIKQEIVFLKERQDLLAQRDLAQQLAIDAQNLQEFKNIFADTAANAFSDFISGTKSAKDAFHDFVTSVTRQINQIAAQNIANAIFGGNNGQNFGDIFSKIFGSLFGASSSGFTGFGTGPFTFAATGTDFARGGLTLVGERGPELVNLPRGSQVIPNDQLNKLGRPNLSIVVNVPQGTSGPSADQIGIRVGAHVQRALSRNG